MSTCNRVVAVVAEQSGVPADEIGPARCLGYQQTPNFYDRDAAARPLELDSLDRVELAMKLETEFSIKISDDEVDLPAIDHVGGLVAFVQGKLDAKPQQTFTYEPEPEAVIYEPVVLSPPPPSARAIFLAGASFATGIAKRIVEGQQVDVDAEIEKGWDEFAARSLA